MNNLPSQNLLTPLYSVETSDYLHQKQYTFFQIKKISVTQYGNMSPVSHAGKHKITYFVGDKNPVSCENVQDVIY